MFLKLYFTDRKMERKGKLFLKFPVQAFSLQSYPVLELVAGSSSK